MFNQHLSLPLAFVANQVSALSTNGQRIFDDVATIQNAQASMNRALKQEDMGLLGPGYGCWCYFEEDHGKGKGEPVDQIDQFCRTLHHGYSCILMDHAEEGCVPWSIPYNSAVGTGPFDFLGMSMQKIRDECDHQNVPGSCEAHTCMVEGYFVQQFILYSTHGGGISDDFRHELGVFDVSRTCKIKTPGSGGGSPGSGGPGNGNGSGGEAPIFHGDKCCGEQPERFPYKSLDGQRDCCVNKTFDTVLRQCCEDGSVQVVC